jgi:hypothetical protein
MVTPTEENTFSEQRGLGFTSTPDKIKIINLMRIEWTEHGACTGEKRTACRILARKLERKRPLGRPKRRLEYRIKMNFREIQWDNMNWKRIGTCRGLL